MKRRVILLGPPGSGKGTFASQLKQEFGIDHVSSGHWLRREVEARTAVGRQAREFLDKGELVPDEMVLEFMEQRLQSELNKPGFLLDGFPRTLGQAKALDEWLVSRGAPIDAVILYDCSEPVIVERITGRRACPKCGRGYHIRNRPPRVAGRCDDCQTALIQRDDDTEAVLRKRLQVYSEQTKPLVDYYRQQRKLTVVDATQPSEVAYAASAKALK